MPNAEIRKWSLIRNSVWLVVLLSKKVVPGYRTEEGKKFKKAHRYKDQSYELMTLLQKVIHQAAFHRSERAVLILIFINVFGVLFLRADEHARACFSAKVKTHLLFTPVP